MLERIHEARNTNICLMKVSDFCHPIQREGGLREEQVLKSRRVGFRTYFAHKLAGIVSCVIPGSTSRQPTGLSPVIWDF